MTTANPSVLGNIDKNAKNSSSSHILWQGSTPLAILQNLVGGASLESDVFLQIIKNS